MISKIILIDDQEVLCRFEEVKDTDGCFKMYKTTPIITENEFLTAFKAWVRGEYDD